MKILHKDKEKTSASYRDPGGKRTPRRSRTQRILAAMMAIVVFCTTYSLILPAITLDAQTALTEPGIEAGEASGETMGDAQASSEILTGSYEAEDAASASEESGGIEAGTAESYGTASESGASGSADESGASGSADESGAGSGADYSSGTENQSASAASADSAGAAAGETQAETEETYAKSPLLWHSEAFDVRLSFKEDVQLPADTRLQIEILDPDKEEDKEDYRSYEARVKKELEKLDEEAQADRAYTLFYYRYKLESDGEEIDLPDSAYTLTITYNHSDKDKNSYKDEELLASLFSHVKDEETLLFDKNHDDSKVISLKNSHLYKIQIKDIALTDYDNVIGLLACPEEEQTEAEAETEKTAEAGKETETVKTTVRRNAPRAAAPQTGYLDLSNASTYLNATLVQDGENTAVYDPSTKTYEMKVKLEFTVPSDDILKDGKTKYDLELDSDVQIPSAYLGQSFSAYDKVSGRESFQYKFEKDETTGKYHMLIEFTDDYVKEMNDDGRSIGKNSVTVDIAVGEDKVQDDGTIMVKVVDDKEIVVTPDQITYPDGTDGKSDLYANKTFGGYDKTTNSMKFKVNIGSNGGTEGEVSFTDILKAAEGSDIDVKSIRVDSVLLHSRNDDWSEKEPQTISGYHVDAAASTGKLTVSELPKLDKNSWYEIEYSYELSDTIAGNDDYNASGNNSVAASTGKIAVKTESGWNVSKTGIGLDKNGLYSKDPDGKNIVTWTIGVVNNTSSPIPLTDEAFKGMNIGSLTISPAIANPAFDSSNGVLTIPADGTYYTITYQTEEVAGDATKSTKVSNTVTAGEGDHQKTTGPVVVEIPAETKVSKTAVTETGTGNERTVTWRVMIDVPSAGFKEGTVFTDELTFEQNNPWQDLSDMADFTESQAQEYEDKLKAIFGDAIDVVTTHSSKVLNGDGSDPNNYTMTKATITATFIRDWSDSAYNGKQIVLDYKSTADVSQAISHTNMLLNTFKINDLPATATHSFSNPVTKKGQAYNPADVTYKTVSKDDKTLDWIIEVALTDDASRIDLTDELPGGVGDILQIRMGAYETSGQMTPIISSNGGLTWGPSTDWSKGYVWEYSEYTDLIPSASRDGDKVSISIKDNGTQSEFLKAGKSFFFYIQVELNEDEFPAYGSETKSYTNHVSVLVDNDPYGEDDQTQQTTLKTDVISKSGDSTSAWNAQNGAHELQYSVEINPSGAHMCYDEQGNKVDNVPITMTDTILYYRNVRDNAGNTHKVSFNLKEGSARLQRKTAEGTWVDIPASEGWGYTLNEDAPSSDPDNIKAKEIQIYGIPDDTPLRFVYTYNVEVEDLAPGATVNLGAIKNTATLKATFEESSSHTESKDWKNIVTTGETDSSGSLNLVKVQKGNYAVTLENVYFKLEKFVPAASGKDEEGTWQPISAFEKHGGVADPNGSGLLVYKTNANGKLGISANIEEILPAGSESDSYYKYDQLYRVREYKTQDGFLLENPDSDDNPAGYFYFHQNDKANASLPGLGFNGTSSHADNLIFEADTVYLTNERLTDTITAQKQWNSSATWPKEEDIISIELTLFDAQGNVAQKPENYTGTWVNPQVLTKDQPQAKWEGLNGNELSSYRVEETRITIGPSSNEIVLTREAKEGSSGEYIWKNGEEVLYETFGGRVTNGMATIVNMSKTKLDFEKVWGTQENIADVQVIMTLTSRERLYARNGVIESTLPSFSGEFAAVEGVEPVVLENPLTGSFENLNKFRYDEESGRLYEIQYSVQEQVIEKSTGKDVTDRYLVSSVRSNDDQKVTITNSSNVGNLKIVKNWQRADGTTGAPADVHSVYVSVERYYVDVDGVRHDDTTFKTENRGYEITDSTDNIGSTDPWTIVLSRVARQVVVQEGNEEKKYDWNYFVREDTVSGFTAAYSDDVTIADENVSGVTSAITVTNVENETRDVPEPIDLQLKKYFADKDGNVQASIPDGASATFRVYRYVTVERGTYDLVTGDMTPNTAQGEARKLDAEFNDSDLDDTYSRTLTSADTAVTDGEGKQYLTTIWSDLPIADTWYRDGEYTKFTYEYFIVETKSSNSSNAQISYIASYLSDEDGAGSVNKPVKIQTLPEAEEGQKPLASVGVKNIESNKTLTVRKYWPSLEASLMPGIVFQLQRSTDMNFGTYESVSAFAVSENGETVSEATEFTVSGSGNKVKGYLLNKENDWNLSFSGLSERDNNGQKYYYRVLEEGYYTKTTEGAYVVMPFLSSQFEVNNRYNYTDKEHYTIDLSGKNVSNLRDIFKENGNWNKTSNNYGTFGIANIPVSVGGQLHLHKHWYGFKGTTGFETLDSNYTGAKNGGKEAYIIVQIYQRPYWATGTHAGEYVTDWTPINEPIKKAFNETIANGWEQAGGGANGQWQLHIMTNTNTAQYGYMENADGIYELVYFDYKIVEVGMEPGSDGSTFHSFYDGYPNEPEKHSDDPSYYTNHSEQHVDNYETGLLELIKDWKLSDTENAAKKVFFTVVDDRGIDIAKQVYDSKDWAYYGVREDQVEYIKELDKYVFVLDAKDKTEDNANRWELIITGLDIIKGLVYETDADGNIKYDSHGNPIPAKENGKIKTYGEVLYSVEEVGVELKDGTISAASSVLYPYNANYYRKVRMNTEQYIGSTATAEGELKADSLQLDSMRAYTEDGSLTSVRVVNSDEPRTSVTVEKTWQPSGQYPDMDMKVVLMLQQRRQKTDAEGTPLFEADGTTPQWADGWTAVEGTNQVSITLPRSGYSGENAWSYTWKGLPVNKELNAVTGEHDVLWYRVIETSSPDWVSTTFTAFDSAGNEITLQSEEDLTGQTGTREKPITQGIVNNTETQTLHVSKIWTNNDPDEADKTETWEQDKSVNWPEGYEIGYKIVRHAYILSVEDAPATEQTKADGSTYQQRNVVYKRASESEIPELLLDPLAVGTLTSTKQTADFSNLPKGDVINTGDTPPSGMLANSTYVIEYEYEVVETSITRDGVTTSTNVTAQQTADANGEAKVNATITNKLTDIAVEKVWEDQNNHTNDSVQVQLYKSSQRPEGAIPVVNGRITIYVDPMTGETRSDMDQGKIFVTVSGDNGIVRDYTLTAGDWSVVTEELPETVVDTGSVITYTVTVRGVDEKVIESASVVGDNTTTVGGKVRLTAKTADPPATFTLTFNPTTWIECDKWQPGASEPSDSNAYITAKVTGNGETHTYTLNKDNHWGADISEKLFVNDDAGNTISYKVEFTAGTSIFQVRKVDNDDGWDNNNTYITGEKGQTVTVGYKPVKEKEQTQGGGQGGAEYTITASVNNWYSWPSDGNRYYKSYKTENAPNSGEITVIVRDGNYNEIGTLLLNSINGWTATGTFSSSNGIHGSAGTVWTSPIDSAEASYSNNSIYVTGYYPESALTTASLFRRTLLAAPRRAPASTNKTFTILGTNDKTPLDAEAIGDPITLSEGNWTYKWDNLPTTDEDGNPIYYYVREISASVDSNTTSITTSYSYEKHNNEDAREGYKKVIVTNVTERDEPETTEFSITKRWMSDHTKWNWSYDGGTIYFKLYQQQGADEGTRKEVTGISSNTYALSRGDTEWVSAAQVGTPETTEGVPNDAQIVISNATPATTKEEGGVTYYQIPYMKTITDLPKLETGWDYVAVEVTSAGEALRAGTDADDQYWSCMEFANTTFALKNDLENVSAKKIWDDGNQTGEIYHPAVTFKLYRAQVPITSESTKDAVENAVKDLKEATGNPARIDVSNTSVWTYMGGTYADKTIAAGTGNNQTVTWEDLPQYNLENGNRYVYVAVEDETGLTDTGYSYGGLTISGNEFDYTNKLDVITLYIKKVWMQKDDSGKWIDATSTTSSPASISYKLYRQEYSDSSLTTKVGDATEVTGKISKNAEETVDIGTISAVKGDDNRYTWQQVVSDLPRVTRTENGALHYYGYYVVETTSGYAVTYKLDNGEENVAADQVVAATKDANGNAGLNIVNRVKEFDIEIVKVDATQTTKTLTGAKFKLYRYDTVKGQAYTKEWDEKDVDENGKLSFTGLTAGAYKLVETQTPTGYVKTDSDPWFTITADASGNLTLAVEEDSATVITYSKESDKHTITVKNTPGASLPATGGMGTTRTYFLGSVLLLLAGMALVMRRRRAIRG